MWSLFIMDLVLKNPNQSLKVVRRKAADYLKVYNTTGFKSVKNDKVRQFIRGYTKYLMSEAIPTFIKNAKKSGIQLPKLEAGETLAGQTEKYLKNELTQAKREELARGFTISILELLYKGNTSFI